LIGCGNYAFTTIAYFLTRRLGRVIAGCMDIDLHRAASLAEHYTIPLYTDDAEEIIGHGAVRMVYIASNHASHAEYAVAALEHGKHVYIEKPHVVTEDQLYRLTAAMRASAGKVFLGFNRPGSRFGKIIKHYLDEQPGPGMYNWFVAGHDLDPDHWYFKPEEGGRVLGNLCHWTDFVLRFVGSPIFPVMISPTRAEKSDSDIAVTLAFADGTIAAITFSAKGHTFEGVKERFSAHKGNCLLTMNDFQTLQIERVHSKKRFRNLFRDHGHRENIVSAAENVLHDLPYDRAAHLAHLWNTGLLFLKTKEALEKNERVVVEEFRVAPAGGAPARQC
jgi:predicted dehydrogenase